MQRHWQGAFICISTTVAATTVALLLPVAIMQSMAASHAAQRCRKAVGDAFVSSMSAAFDRTTTARANIIPHGASFAIMFESEESAGEVADVGGKT